MVSRSLLEQRNEEENEEQSLNQNKLRPHMQKGYETYQGTLQDYRKSTKHKNLPTKPGNMPDTAQMDNKSSSHTISNA